MSDNYDAKGRLLDERDDYPYDEVSCWQCFGEGHLGSNCIDDLCHGGECIHGDSGTIRCDVCHGTGTITIGGVE